MYDLSHLFDPYLDFYFLTVVTKKYRPIKQGVNVFVYPCLVHIPYKHNAHIFFYDDVNA